MKLAILALVVFLVAGALCADGNRFALVVGNADYGALGQLKNPTNDAQDVGAALKALGFQTEVLLNADLPTMENAVVKLSSQLTADKGSTGFFFYAGHGIQSGGTNYLLPARVEIAAEAFLKTKALSAQSVMDLLQSSGNGLNIVVLDACRDNPFAWSRSLSRGLSVVSNQPPGSIIAYATSAGSTAQDGTGRNGVFTGELLKNLKTPGIDIKQVFDRTGGGVVATTNSKQVPAIYSQYFGTFYLAGAPVAAVPVASPVARPEAPPADGPVPSAVNDQALSAWVWLGNGGPGQGLLFRPNGGEDRGEAASVAGRSAWTVTGTPQGAQYPTALYFDVEDSKIRLGVAAKVALTVEYFDDAAGRQDPWINLQYSSFGKHPNPNEPANFQSAQPRLVLGKSRTWKSYTWVLDDAAFNRKANGHDFRFSGAPGLPFSLASVSLVRSEVSLTALDGIWYFQGTGAGQGQGPGTHQDSRLVIDAATLQLSYYHYDSPATLKSWVRDRLTGTDTIDAVDGDSIHSTLSVAPKVAWSTAQVGAQTRTLYRLQGDELQLWWDWGQGLPDPYDWTDYVSYKRTRAR
jgi:hypothetical protein